MKTHVIPSGEIVSAQSAQPAACATAQARAAEINRLHDDVRRLSEKSRCALDGALAAALSAGRLLQEHKAHLHHTAGRGAWETWLKTCFHGGRSTAYRYMQLARETPGENAVHALRGLSLRQAYLRLGIATEPKTATQHSVTAATVPEPVILAQKLTRLLRRQRAPKGSLREELAALYRLLQLVLAESSC